MIVIVSSRAKEKAFENSNAEPKFIRRAAAAKAKMVGVHFSLTVFENHSKSLIFKIYNIGLGIKIHERLLGQFSNTVFIILLPLKNESLEPS